jgi:two-component system, NtrC family, sensor kinase
MKRLWSNFDLQGKSRILAVLGITIWLINFLVIYFEIDHINHATVSLERVEDLYNTVLEMRRYEKNFLLYQGQDNRDQTLSFYRHAKAIYSDMAASPESFGEKVIMKELNTTFSEYSKVLEKLLETGINAAPSEAEQEEIRSSGRQMVDLAQGLLDQNRNMVARTAGTALRLPLVSTGLILALFIVGFVLIYRKVINPLVLLERATEKIGQGDFSAISHPSRIESEVDRLVLAFNRMAEELDARQEQIIHSRKIASLGTLVSGVAHELNNPINNIILTIDTLVSGRKVTDDRRSEMLDDILNQAIRASGIVKNLLDFSRAETSSFKDVDIGRLLEDIFKIAGNEISLKKIVLHKHIDPNLPNIRGSLQGLQQVFFNLVINAVQAMSENGELSVWAVKDENKRIIVTVQDTGIGISEEDLPHIFDPFFTTKEVGHGTGLGLSVSYGIIKKHGGRITVESQPGEGTIFTVILPSTKEMIDA